MKNDTNHLRSSAYQALFNYHPNLLKRGNRLLSKGFVTNLQLAGYEGDPGSPDVVYEVESESEPDYCYHVSINYDTDIYRLIVYCPCFYFEKHEECKHAAAALLDIAHNKGQQSRNISSGKAMFIPDLSVQSLQSAFGKEVIQKARQVVPLLNAAIPAPENGEVKTDIHVDNVAFTIGLSQTKSSAQMEASCSCGKQNCEHIAAVLLSVGQKYGKLAFPESHNWEKEKKEIRDQYGLDENTSAIEFTFEQGRLSHNTLMPGLLPVNEIPDLRKSIEKITPDEKVLEALDNRTIVYFICQLGGYYNQDVQYAVKTGTGKIGKRGSVLKNSIEIIDSPLADREWLSLSDETDQSLAKGLDQFLQIHLLNEQPKKGQRKYNHFKELLPKLKGKQLYWGNSYRSYHTHLDNMNPLAIGEGEISTRIHCHADQEIVTIQTEMFLDGQEIKPDEQHPLNDLLFHYKHKFYPWRSVYDYLAWLIITKNGPVVIARNQWDSFYQNNLAVLSRYVTIQTNKTLMETETLTEVIPSFKIVLGETSGFLLIYPVAIYQNTEVNALEDGLQVFDKNRVITRNKQAEDEFLALITGTHPGFSPDTFQDFFHLSVNKVMENLWFLDFYEVCQQNNIEMYGIDKLKKIQYSPVKPTINYGVSSGTDWFDVNLSVAFDQETVPLKQLRKTVVNNQNLVKLSNGKYGIIPEEWLNRFKAMLRYGKINEEGVQLRKSQFMIIENLFDELKDPDVVKEIMEKKQLLNNFDGIAELPVPKDIKAELRHYQEAGLNWLAFLADTGLGGCLADDMGLGKTLQMISLLVHLKNHDKRKNITNLVVCPTSLVFNWQNELEKFAPKLSYAIHWGSSRSDHKEWKKNDVVITTYGTLVNDIEKFRTLTFDTLVLDESQAIKNPDSLRYKAVCLLKAQRRFVMTGTPIENNTVELYAQMNFLNPGLLGNLSFFRKEFAGAVEQTKDKEKLEELRTLIKPFILRRTKEQVMTELPDKTEVVHYCEMGDEQRKVYDAFRSDFRNRLLGKIEEEGLNKSRFTILEGLTKMRQICDSPALLSTQEGYGNASVKADELTRLITTKIANHKALVFSQFLGMLDIIEQRLSEQGIKYSILTGKTTNRKKAVEAFENDPECRVFLISLKAGGQGLNLVSADYVFLVDPWWNPAVENQAIDRAHRMGQTKKVFAYRMVCKDTVEEKIVELQQRKKQLAEDIITSEQGFVKKLSKSDIEGLFR
ncbi:MAG: DEAD/DEAH box helicase family protein [Bacteroidetes bacterium]|jgi:non-specific serine/threonine protein kinase|nr:DEAD/DEAH box helicase family protein [Bacteroidota bacterium]